MKNHVFIICITLLCVGFLGCRADRYHSHLAQAFDRSHLGPLDAPLRITWKGQRFAGHIPSRFTAIVEFQAGERCYAEEIEPGRYVSKCLIVSSFPKQSTVVRQKSFEGLLALLGKPSAQEVWSDGAVWRLSMSWFCAVERINGADLWKVDAEFIASKKPWLWVKSRIDVNYGSAKTKQK